MTLSTFGCLSLWLHSLLPRDDDTKFIKSSSRLGDDISFAVNAVISIKNATYFTFRSGKKFNKTQNNYKNIELVYKQISK